MQRTTLALLACLAALWPLTVTAQTPTPTPNDLHCIAGVLQSNAVGEAPEPAPTRTPNSRIFNFRNDYSWAVLQEPADCGQVTCGLSCDAATCPHNCTTVGCSDTVNDDAPFTLYGPFQRLTRDLALTNLSWHIGLVNTAKGSTGICQWRSGNPGYQVNGLCNVLASPNPTDRTTLFGAFNTRMTTAKATRCASLDLIVAIGMESDANQTQAVATASATNLTDFIADLRAAQGAGPAICYSQLPNLPTSLFQFRDTVRDGQQVVANVNLPRVGMVITSQYGCVSAGNPPDTADGCHCTGLHTGSAACDLPLQSGSAHYTADGYDLLADRLNECWQVFAATPTPAATATRTPCPTCTPPSGSAPGTMGSCLGGLACCP